MGFFLVYFNYFEKGVMHIPLKVRTLMSYISNLFYLNIIATLFSLPLITIFPSFFALVDLINRIPLNEPQEFIGLFKEFNRSFRSVFTRAYKFAAVFLPLVLIVLIDLNILKDLQTPLAQVHRYTLLIGSVVITLVANYVVYLQVTRPQTLRESLMMALIISVKNPIQSALLLVFYIAFISLFLVQTGLALLFILSLPAFIICFISKQTESGGLFV